VVDHLQHLASTVDAVAGRLDGTGEVLQVIHHRLAHATIA